MVITTKAIVFSSLKYGESDLIVKCFTESSGLKSYLLRNILKSKKGKLRSSYFQSLSLLEIEAYHKNKGTLERINEAKIFYTYQSLHTNVIKSSLVIFLAEILSNTIYEEAEDKMLFRFIENSLSWLDNSKDIANFHISFLLKLSLHLGFYPDTSSIAKPYFNLLEGNFQDVSIGKYNEIGAIIDNLKMFFGIDFDKIDEIKLTKNQRSDLLSLLLKYYQLHLHGFKEPKSLIVLNQIFE
ncbi:MAG: DNA repair protein RecO [Flavobacteriaceae bacterium]|nr:DNA repair protein RecO [Flavobacteriaceae bacterium]